MVQHQNQIDGVLFRQKQRSFIQSSKKKRSGTDCGSDHELLIGTFKLKLKTVGKTIRPYGYDLNQIPYDYSVEVMDRFKRLNLVDSLKTYGYRFLTLYRRQ